MTISCRSTATIVRRLAALLLFAAATAGAADVAMGDPTARPAIKDRLQVTVVAGDSLRQRIALSDRIDRDLLAYHFRLEAVDARGGTIALPAAVSLTLRVGSGDRGSQLLFSAAGQDLTIPRPWALRLRTEDSLFIIVELGGDTVDAVSLRVSIDYEPVGRDRSRLAITSARADQRGAIGDEASVWEWTQPTDGRLIAITGLPLEQLRQISLVEVESGRVMWSADLGGEMVMAPTSAGSPALRFGVPVVAGRTYRLVAGCACDSSTRTPAEQVVAMVLPTAAP